MNEVAPWVGIGVTLVIAVVGALWSSARCRGYTDATVEDLKRDLVQERIERERGDFESRTHIEKSVTTLTDLVDRLLHELGDEVRRVRHQGENNQTMLTGIIEQLGKSEGRREVFEQEVRRLQDHLWEDRKKGAA